MNRWQGLVIIALCLLHLTQCTKVGNIRTEYADWEALMKANENEVGWFPPLFNNSDVLLEGNIFNIVIVNNPSRIDVWGKFTFSDNFLNYFPLQLNPFENNLNIMDNRHKKLMSRIGFEASKIDFYFVQISDDKFLRYSNRIWYYFVSTSENLIFFCTFWIQDYTSTDALIKLTQMLSPKCQLIQLLPKVRSKNAELLKFYGGEYVANGKP